MGNQLFWSVTVPTFHIVGFTAKVILNKWVTSQKVKAKDLSQLVKVTFLT